MKISGKITAFIFAVIAVISSVSLGVCAETDNTSYSACLNFQAGTNSTLDNEELDCVEAAIDGDGSYFVSVTMSDGAASISRMILSTNINAFDYAPENADADGFGIPEGCTVDITIDSIMVNCVDTSTYSIAYTGPSEGAFCTNADDSTICVNILNTEQTPSVEDISAKPENGLSSGDTIVVKFTVIGLDAKNESSDSSTDDIVVLKGDADRSGDITLNDAYLTLLYYAEHAVSNDSYVFDVDPDVNAAIVKAVDVDEDGDITLNDAYVILLYYANHAVNYNVTWEELVG